MLKRIYVDNYKTLVNFELSIGEISLLLGANGSGKSAVLEVLRKVQGFCTRGGRLPELFPPDTLTRWQTSRIQTIGLDVQSEDGLLRYELAVEHTRPPQLKSRVRHERLSLDGHPLLRFEMGEVQLYRDDFSEGPTYSFDWTSSAAASIPERHDNTRLTWFKGWLDRLTSVQIIPTAMEDESAEEQAYFTLHMENFVSWYRYISQDQGVAIKVTDALRKVLPGFEHFRFEPVGERHRLLKAYFRGDSEPTATGYALSELSDGQRTLIALYSLLHALRADRRFVCTICLDEPDNFIALPEIQPWLTELYDLCSGGELQAILISHHPEMINYLLASPGGFWFEREPERPTRVRAIVSEGGDGLAAAELVARGWLNV